MITLCPCKSVSPQPAIATLTHPLDHPHTCALIGDPAKRSRSARAANFSSIWS